VWRTLEIKQCDISTFELQSIVKDALEELEDEDRFFSILSYMASIKKKVDARRRAEK
jgi:phosphoribosylaminoimidazole carboxylase (NCAIR synthetase)